MGPSPEPSMPESDTATSSTPTEPPTPAIVLTDVLHLLDAPHLAADLNVARYEPYRNEVPGVSEALAGTFGVLQALRWSMPMPELPQLTGSIVLWVEVEGVVTHDATEPCFWQVSWRVDNADGFVEVSGACGEEPTVVPTGIRALELDLQSYTAPYGFVGQTLSIQISSTALPSPDGRVNVLSGTTYNDSLLTIEGLQLPLDFQSVLI